MKEKSIGLGTSAIGRPIYINIKSETQHDRFSIQTFRANSLDILEQSYRLGIRHFDTSPGYGLAESLLIEWLAKKKDPSLSVSTKWGYRYVADFAANATEHEIKDHTLANLKSQWEHSKKLLPFLNIYQIHSATFDTGVLKNNEILKYLYLLKKEHNLTLGLSTTGNFQTDVIKEAMNIKIGNEILFESFQSTYNILEQTVLKFSRLLHNIGRRFIIKEALANGRLIPSDSFPHYNQLYNCLKELAAKYDVGTDAIAIRFCMESFPEAIVLSGVNNKDHLAANLKAEGITLDKRDFLTIKSFSVSSADYWKERANLRWQ